jgi:hypothetical protein
VGRIGRAGQIAGNHDQVPVAAVLEGSELHDIDTLENDLFS